MTIGATNRPNATARLDDDELLLLFLTGRGHSAFREWAKEANEAGWSRVDLRFMLEALYQRLGVVIRNEQSPDDLLRFLRVLRETLATCASASEEVRTRLASLSEFVTDLINQDGGSANEDLLDDSACLALLERLNLDARVPEEMLVQALGDKALFNRAICNLHVAGLVSLIEDNAWSWELTARGKRRINSKSAPHLLEKLDPFTEDILLFTPVRPLFDMLILLFGQAARDKAEHYRINSPTKLSNFGVEVRSEPMEQPLDSWLSLDEVYLQRRSRSMADIPAITGPGKRESLFFRTSVVDVSTGNAFVGFHLLVSDFTLDGLKFSSRKGLLPPRFPAGADEIRSIVKWSEFGSWLSENELSAEIVADSGTRPLIEALLALSPGSKERVTFLDVESNTRRLDMVQTPQDGRITLAAATGPLLAIARHANLSVLISAWDMLETARRAKVDYEMVSSLLLKQVVHIAVPRNVLDEVSYATSTILEDRLFRVFGFVEAVYHLIVSEPDAFAEFCSDQWKALHQQFPRFREFEFELSPVDVRFAVEGCYRWLGQDLAQLKPATTWPDDSISLQTCQFWTVEDEGSCFWPKILARRQEVQAQIDSLLGEALSMTAVLHESEARALTRRVTQLCEMGQLRKAESGLRHAIVVLKDYVGEQEAGSLN